MASRCKHQHLTHRFSPGSKLFFGTVVGWLTCWVRAYDSCDMKHAAPGSVLRASRSSNASSGLPGPPAGGRGKDGLIHNDKLRHSTAAQREVAPLCVYICCHHFLYISILCWRVLLLLQATCDASTSRRLYRPTAPTPAPQCRLPYHPRRRPGFVYFCILGRIRKYFMFPRPVSGGAPAYSW